MKIILRKIAALVITLLIISFVTFFAFTIIPGDAATGILDMDATQEEIDALREAMGLNDNIFLRYGRWIAGALHGDLGKSLKYDMTVNSLLGSRLPATFGLSLEALLIIALVSVPLAVLSSKKPEGILDNIITVITQAGMALPQFFIGILLTYIFGMLLKWFPIGEYKAPEENFGGFLFFLIVPAITVAIPKCSMMTKYIRDNIVAQKKQDYVRTAKAKGNSENKILIKHILKNTMMPTITFYAMIVADVLAGSIVVEQVFQIPGVGRLLVASISNRDYPVVSAIVMYTAAIVVIMNTLADILARIIDPRVKS